MLLLKRKQTRRQKRLNFTHHVCLGQNHGTAPPQAAHLLSESSNELLVIA